MQEHHGLKLKERVKRSSLMISEIVERSGVPVSSLYDMYKRPELLRSKVAPILKVLKIHPDDFFRSGSNLTVNDDGDTPSDTNTQLSQLITLFKKQVALQEEMLSLMKKKK